MNHAALAPARDPRALVSGLGLLAGAAALTAFAMALALLLYRHPPSSLIVIGFAVVLLGALLLALFAHNTALAVGVVLLAAVRFEPAPTDVVFAVLMVVALATGRFRLRRVTPGPILLVGAFLAFNLVSIIDVGDTRRGLQFLGITVYVAVLGLWLASHVTSSPAATRIVRWYVIAAVASAVLSTLALVAPFPGHDLFTRIGRAEGLFKDPNVFGPFLVPPALIMLEELLTPRLFSWRRSTKLLCFLALTLGVLFSYSRAAWLNLVAGLVVMVVVFSFRKGGGRHAARALALVLTAAIAVGVVVSVTGSVSFLEQRAQVQTYDSGRFAGQSESIHWATEYPFGIGPGQFERNAQIAAHSMYARALAEEGLPGLVTLLVLMLGTFYWAARNAVLGRDTYGIGSAALLGAWTGVLLNGFFVDTLHWRHLWLVAALIWAGSARRPGSPSS
jgi:O-antigen ligase